MKVSASPFLSSGGMKDAFCSRCYIFPCQYVRSLHLCFSVLPRVALLHQHPRVCWLFLILWCNNDCRSSKNQAAVASAACRPGRIVHLLESFMTLLGRQRLIGKLRRVLLQELTSSAKQKCLFIFITAKNNLFLGNFQLVHMYIFIRKLMT